MDRAYEEVVQQVREMPASFGHTKRLIERYMADADTPNSLLFEPETLPERLGDHTIDVADRAVFEKHAAVRNRLLAETHRLCRPSHPRLRAWHARQIQRTRWELGSSADKHLVHAPLAVELSRGCSVKCWFCGVGAQPFGGSLPYSEKTAAEWQATLLVLQDFLGPSLAFGFLYWATDPLDNPDYEKFMLDFHAIAGSWPQTTTALALRDVERTRRLLKLGAEHGRIIDRFSVLSRSFFNRILDEFSPEELLHVELIPQFNDRVAPKSFAGSARERTLRKQAAAKNTPGNAPENTVDAQAEPSPLLGGTIACVSGFLFNLVERSVRLISPCSASPRWPLGYIVFDEFTYTDVADLRDKLNRSIATRMPTAVRAEMKMGFGPGCTVEYPADGTFALRSRFWKMTFEKIGDGADLARRVEKGTDTAGEIATARWVERGIDPVQTFLDLNLLFQKGVLAEEILPTEEKLVLIPLRTASREHTAQI